MKTYQDMYDNKNCCYFNDMPEKFRDNTNKIVHGKFKGETAGIPIKKFIGLISKMCRILIDNSKEKKTANGIGTSVIKRKIKHETYKDILNTSLMMKVIRK